MSIAWPFKSRVAISNIAAVTSPAFPHTTGNQLVFGIVYQSTGTVTSVTDTAGNTYTQCGTQSTDGGSNKIQLWRAFNITGNAANVLTPHLGSGTFSFCGVMVIEMSMVGTSDPFQNTASASGNSTTPSSGSVTVSGDSALISIGVANGGSILSGTGGSIQTNFFGRENNPDNGGFFVNTFELTSTSKAAAVKSATGTWGVLAGSFTIPTVGSGGASTAHSFVAG